MEEINNVLLEEFVTTGGAVEPKLGPGWRRPPQETGRASRSGTLLGGRSVNVDVTSSRRQTLN